MLSAEFRREAQANRATTPVDSQTEIATGLTVAMYRDARPRLDPGSPQSAEWLLVFKAFRRRLSERFLKPIKDLARYDNQRYVDQDDTPTRPGFAILALDCLLIDTLQSFREGRVSTGEVNPAKSF